MASVLTPAESWGPYGPHGTKKPLGIILSATGPQ